MNDLHRIIFITEIKSLILFSKYQNLIKKGYTMGPQLRKECSAGTPYVIGVLYIN